LDDEDDGVFDGVFDDELLELPELPESDDDDEDDELSEEPFEPDDDEGVDDEPLPLDFEDEPLLSEPEPELPLRA
jgi:hypothetical protein